MSLLTLIQDAADRLGIPRPSAVVGTSDTQVRQLLGLAQQEGKELSKMGNWQALVTEKTFTATATETQSSVIPTDFGWIIEGSFWNRTQDRRVMGPLDPQKWQALQTGLYTSIWDAFRIRGDSMIMNPVPTAGNSMAYEYVSKYWCQNAAGSTQRAAWLADDDTGRLDEELMTLGVMWRFLKAKGLDYSEPFRTYQMQVDQAFGRDGGTRILDLGADSGGSGVFDPFVPEGSWTV
jgi:hypothetical protein